MSSTATIVFGTDGWRGVIARDYTFDNVSLVARAAATYFATQKFASRGIIVGYDSRFLSRAFAETAARVIADAGLTVWLCDDIATTPMVSLAVKLKKCAGGAVITASHNPPEYNGFKLKGSFGGPAHPEQVAEVEKLLAKVKGLKEPSPLNDLIDARKVRLFDAKRMYVEYVREKIDLALIREKGLRIIYDPMYGAGINTIHHLVPEATVIHNEYNPSFGEIDHPEPMAEYLGTLIGTIRRERQRDIGIATDGDADRVGAVDEEGSFVDSHRLFVLTLKYLVEQRGLTGEVAKTVSLTSMVDDYCKARRIKLHETPVGFKYICALMTTRPVIIGGEESGGYATNLHIPERDGIFNGLLLAEIVARSGKSLSQLVREMHHELGTHRYRRIDIRMTQAQKGAVLKKAQQGPKTLGKYVVRSTNTRDGFKFLVDHGWLLVRASGTEPLVRFYAEGRTGEQVEELLRAGMKMKETA